MSLDETRSEFTKRLTECYMALNPKGSLDIFKLKFREHTLVEKGKIYEYARTVFCHPDDLYKVIFSSGVNSYSIDIAIEAATFKLDREIFGCVSGKLISDVDIKFPTPYFPLPKERGNINDFSKPTEKIHIPWYLETPGMINNILD